MKTEVKTDPVENWMNYIDQVKKIENCCKQHFLNSLNNSNNEIDLE